MAPFDTLTPYHTETQTYLPFTTHSHSDSDERALYEHFMKHMQNVPHNRLEIRILSTIHFTADTFGYSDAYVARILVDCGLRAPRMAFPQDFLSFADNSLKRSRFEQNSPSRSLTELQNHWIKIGEQ